MEKAGFKEFPKDTAAFLELCKALKANNTPAGFALGHASGDANTWLHWALWAHGGNLVDKTDKVVINSPETVKALEYVKALYDTFIPGTASWNDSSNNKIFVAGDLHLTSNGISIYVAAQKENKAVAEDMNHAYMPIGPIGKPTELHLAFPILTFGFTKAPQACKALTAFMLEAENFNPWVSAAQGYLSHFLLAYDNNPVWTADPKRTVLSRRGQAHADPRRAGLARRKGGGGDRRLHRGGYVRELCDRPRGRQGRHRGGRAAGATHLSLTITTPAAGLGRPPANSQRRSAVTSWSMPRSPHGVRHWQPNPLPGAA